MKTPNYFMEMPSHCGCVLPEGHRGSRGWHYHQTQHSVTQADQVTAYERCPKYWREAGFQVDPSDRRMLVAKEKSKRTAKVRA